MLRGTRLTEARITATTVFVKLKTNSISLPLTLLYAKLRKLLCIKTLAKIQFYVDIIDKV